MAIDHECLGMQAAVFRVDWRCIHFELDDRVGSKFKQISPCLQNWLTPFLIVTVNGRNIM